jgi:hypothetical protein
VEGAQGSGGGYTVSEIRWGSLIRIFFISTQQASGSACTSGILGLWERIGEGGVAPAVPLPQFIVVKQVARANRRELRTESRIMERIMASTAPAGSDVRKLPQSGVS